MKIHVFIISWGSYFQSACDIADEICDSVDFLTIISSDPLNYKYRSGAYKIIHVPSSWFYSKKCQTAFCNNLGDVHLQIHADAVYEDWNFLIQRCKLAFSNKRIGILAPNIDYTPWLSPNVNIGSLDIKTGLVQVAQTDAIVWAIRINIVNYMAQLDYNNNRFGWGIDWAAIAYCHTLNLKVVRDMQLMVKHPKLSGYDRDVAKEEMRAFLLNLNPSQFNIVRKLMRYCESRGLLC